jgi:hypothetical protein
LSLEPVANVFPSALNATFLTASERLLWKHG